MTGGNFLDLKRQISEELELYRGDRSRPGFRAMATYRFGVWAAEYPRDGLIQKVFGRLLDAVYVLAHRYVRNQHGIEIHRTADIGHRVRFPHQGGIVIHHYATIGDNTVIQHGVTIGSAGRGVTREEAPNIGADVEIGPGVVILGRVNVGRGARISPNVVIYTDVAEGATVVANSPRVIYAPNTKKRSDMGSANDESDT